MLWFLLPMPSLARDAMVSGSLGTSGLQTQASRRGPAQKVCAGLPGALGRGQTGQASGCSWLQASECQAAGPGTLPLEL